MCPNDAGGMANSVVPDQTHPCLHYSVWKLTIITVFKSLCSFKNGLLPVFSSFDIMWISCPIASTAHILYKGVPLGVWGHTILKFIAASHTKSGRSIIVKENKKHQ